MYLPQLGRRLIFRRAGWIRPVGAGGACEALIDDVTTCVLYAEIVDGHVKKFGTTRSLQDRQFTNRNTINKILEFQDGRSHSINKKITDPSTYDKFKQQAPEVTAVQIRRDQPPGLSALFEKTFGDWRIAG